MHKARTIREGRTQGRRGMTLTEMLVVTAVVVVILALAIPALSVWEARKFQDAINMTDGLMQSAQTTAITKKKTIGLFFYVDPNSNAQYIWPIERSVHPNSPSTTAQRFVLRDVPPFKFPPPFRAVPISVLNTNLPLTDFWTDDHLADNSLYDAPQVPAPGLGAPFWAPALPGQTDTIGSQYHRNFFVMLFDEEGRIKVDPGNFWERIFIADFEVPQIPGDHPNPPELSYPGFRTGLLVQDIGPVDREDTLRDDDTNPTVSTELLLFAAAEGILVYNDEEYQLQAVGNHRSFLRKAGEPVIVHSVTGSVIRGEPEG